jgi:ferric-dicitrate binding protein FerR (iron transport regulator)
MENNRLQFLFQLYIEQHCSPDEETELMQLIADSTDEERNTLVYDCFDKLPIKHTLNDSDADRIFNQIIEVSERKTISSRPKSRRLMLWLSISAAAVLVFAVTFGILNTPRQSPNEINQIVEIVKPLNKPLYKNDVRPGGNKAYLTLADGSKIILDNVSNGKLAQQGNAQITKLDSGRLSYNLKAIPNLTSNIISYNTLTTPRGGQYRIILSDGTIVWLNASTSLRFPITFVGKERRVEVKGEAYFEVAKNAAMPFIVKVGNSEVRVLGTHFNVMAYADDKVVKTTLLEGSVDVSYDKLAFSGKLSSHVILHPGQQAQLDRNNEMKVMDADLEEAIAWKNGNFIFNNEDIKSIMAKISRWYDVKVDYQIDPANKTFSGKISRIQNVSEVLNMFELTETIHFKIEGKTITILP